jgi:UDPglucose 6-dehydrogenase
MIFRPFAHLAGTVGVDFEILKVAERVNEQRIDRFLEKVHRALWIVKEKPVAILGLAFKFNTDDIRFSPALDVARRMIAEGADVHATDPEAMTRAAAILAHVTYHHDPYEALRDGEAALICTECEEFRQLDWERVGKLMARRLVNDGRNLCSRRECATLISNISRLGENWFAVVGKSRSDASESAYCI